MDQVRSTFDNVKANSNNRLDSFEARMATLEAYILMAFKDGGRRLEKQYSPLFNFIHKNGMGPSVIYSFPKGFDRKLVEKKKDLDTLMSNLLEYVFLVRDIKDLNEENISNAPKKARLYNEFDETISKIMFRSRLIAFLLKVAG